MPTENNITHDRSINNFIIKLGLTLYLTIPQLKHVCKFLYGTVGRGCNAKVSHIAGNCFYSTHRTSIGKFLSKSSWNEDFVLKALQKFAIKRIWQVSQSTGKPIYVIIDDTISKKTKTSSRANNPIQKYVFHKSHLEGKTVYGHQVVGILLQCDDVVIPYQLILYDKDKVDENKEKVTKIKIAINAISALPKPPKQGFVLGDSWYSAEKIIKAANANGFDYIGALKTNRVIYPKCCRISQQISGFAKMINKEDFHLVTVNKNSYYVYRYQGRINGFKEVTIVISYPKNAVYNKKAVKAFISTDTSLKTKDILVQYTECWTIKVFFRQNKMELGLDSYQIRSEKAIKRFWILTQLTYLYCTFGVCENHCKFGESLKLARIQKTAGLIDWIYIQAKNGVAKENIINSLGLSKNKCA